MSASDFRNAEDERFYRIPEALNHNANNDSEMFEGDILLEEADSGYNAQLITDINKKWPKVGEYVIVPFTFPSTASDQAKADIARMVLEFRTKTCVRYDSCKIITLFFFIFYYYFMKV